MGALHTSGRGDGFCCGRAAAGPDPVPAVAIAAGDTVEDRCFKVPAHDEGSGPVRGDVSPSETRYYFQIASWLLHRTSQRPPELPAHDAYPFTRTRRTHGRRRNGSL